MAHEPYGKRDAALDGSRVGLLVHLSSDIHGLCVALLYDHSGGNDAWKLSIVARSPSSDTTYS